MSKITTPAGQPIECTCNKIDCYSCRRREIDATALRIVKREIDICTGIGYMTPEKVEAHAWAMAQDYRCKAINSLAMEFAA